MSECVDLLLALEKLKEAEDCLGNIGVRYPKSGCKWWAEDVGGIYTAVECRVWKLEEEENDDCMALDTR